MNNIDDHLEFRLLKYFLAVVEAGTFTAAAAKLHVAQSAISTQIGKLEDMLNVQLFDREHGYKLTAEGLMMKVYAESSLKRRTLFIQTLLAIHSASLQPLRLGFSSFVLKGLLHFVSDTYKELLPGCEMLPESGDTVDILERLRAGDLDAALLTLPVAGDDLEVHVLERERLLVCMRNDDPLASYEAVPASALSGKISIFTYQKYHPAAYERLLEMFKEVGITPRPCQPTQNIEHVQWMVKEGHCYSLIRAGRTLQNGLVVRPIVGVDWTVDSGLVLREGHENPALAFFVEELVNPLRHASDTPVKKPVASVAATVQRKSKSGEKTDDQMGLFNIHHRP
ncbi:LysR family transcriptional regulator [Paracidobacterium acidisoli]|uniref:LysR family transcriptional regulator n=1 Tax=Paracidobacterium acidisoli TaxID=2303751 RepID=A0A372IT73_9BACT|nr:LysR family transcriptional regulator [Paracidobacterium acidisoli]MBT9329517.1 LysR family transcriptional regulator [Paracidobacterium acidisoli]